MRVIVLLEGEKCADLAISVGLPYAIASAHGAKAPQLTDWSPLSGKNVVILRDEDAEGEGYAAKAAALLGKLDPPAAVRTVRLPGLSAGEDIEQFIAQRRERGLSDAAILAELHALIAPALTAFGTWRDPLPAPRRSKAFPSAFASVPRPWPDSGDPTAAAGPVKHRLYVAKRPRAKGGKPPSSPGRFVRSRRCDRRPRAPGYDGCERVAP